MDSTSEWRSHAFRVSQIPPETQKRLPYSDMVAFDDKRRADAVERHLIWRESVREIVGLYVHD